MINKILKVMIRTFLVLLIIALQVNILDARAQHTSDWKFTQQDFENLTEAQKSIIKQSYWIGKPHGLGNTLAAISIVETRAGAYPDRSYNRICGAHQVDVMIVKENTGTTTHPKVLCKALQDNPVLSAIVAMQILLYWRDNSSTFRGMLNKYNRGWNQTPYDDEFYRRMYMTLKVLEGNNIENLKGIQ